MSRIRTVFKCGSEKKQLFSQSRCLLTISVGQEAHEGEKFEGVVQLVNHSFQSCILLVDDSLQRHTMAIGTGHDGDYFYKASMQAGDAWLERNESVYSKLNNLESIVRWDRWLYHPQAAFWRDKIEQQLFQDSQYSGAFDETINEFLRRYCRRNFLSEAELVHVRQLCREYLKEECVAMCLWPELNCHFEVYPSARNQAMAATHEKFVIPSFPHLLHTVNVKYINRKQFKAQLLMPVSGQTTQIAA